MYMYYFLGHRLEDNMNLTDQQKKARKHNTYLLALDGDVDFQVKSVSIQIINGFLHVSTHLGHQSSRLRS